MNRQSTPLVLCHNDILLNNILYEENTNNVHIIDYEYLGANPAAYDIANHFAEYAGTDEVSSKLNFFATTFIKNLLGEL